MRLVAIGTSGSFPGPGAAASCYLVEAHDGQRTWRVLLDLGSGALGALQTVCGLDQVDAVVLSHLHPDHCMDITGLYVARIYDPRRADDTPRIPVYAPGGALQRLGAASNTDPGLSPVASQHQPTDLAVAFDFHTVTQGAPFTVGPLTMEPFLVDHPVETYALRISDPHGHVLTYSGDTDECDALVRAATDSDLFLCEAAFQEGREEVRGIHLTGLRAGRVAARAAARRLVITHIPPWTDTSTVATEAAGEYAGPIDLAAPLMAWDVAATAPAHDPSA